MTIKMFDDKFSTPTARVKPTDLNDTNSFLLQQAASGQAELAFKTLQSNNIFENGGTLATDEYVDATGTNDTVNVGSTDAVFNTNLYECKGGAGSYSDSVIVHDSNTLPINSETKAFCVHHEGEIPTDTSVEYEVSDTPVGISLSEEEDLAGATTSLSGIRLKALSNLTIKGVNKLSTSTATRAQVYINTVLQQTVNFIGDNATFSSVIPAVTDDIIELVVDANGGSYNNSRDTTTGGSHQFTLPYTDKNVEVKGGLFSVIGGADILTQLYNISSVVFDTSGANKITLPINPITKKSQVVDIGDLEETDNVIITCKLGTEDAAKTSTSSGFAIKRID